MVDRLPNLFVDKKSNKVIGGRFMKKILITGGAGFIGVHLAQRFATLGYQTTLVDNLRRGVLDSELDSLLQRPEIEFAQINLLEPEALSQLPDDYTHIVHLAAIIGVKHVMQSLFETLADNISMVRNIVAFSHRQTRWRDLPSRQQVKSTLVDLSILICRCQREKTSPLACLI